MRASNTFSISVAWATLGPIGYLPAPGTVATLVTMPFVYAVSSLPLVHLGVIAVLTAIGYVTTKNAQTHFKSHDPRQVVIDETIGCFITFFTISFSIKSYLIGFMLFRFFDITKPLYIRRLEQINGPWGVLLDDAAAGVISNLLLRTILWLI